MLLSARFQSVVVVRLVECGWCCKPNNKMVATWQAGTAVRMTTNLQRFYCPVVEL
jgi:hypothetical protein